MKEVLLVCFALMTLNISLAQERPLPNHEPEELNFDTVHIHFQSNFIDDRVLLFANGVKIYDGILFSNITQGAAGEVIKLPYIVDTLNFTFIYFEKDHHWSLEMEPIYFDSKSIEFQLVPSEQGRYLGLFVSWDLEKSYHDERLKRAINLFPGYIVSKEPFIYY